MMRISSDCRRLSGPACNIHTGVVMNKGFLAGIYLKKDKKKNEEAWRNGAHFIEDCDYFEKTKNDLLKEFGNVSADEGIFVVAHREDLM